MVLEKVHDQFRVVPVREIYPDQSRTHARKKDHTMNISHKKAANSWVKVGVTAAILIGSAAIVGTGAFAVFTSSATANAAVNAGAIKINLVDSNITASGMAPGDTIQELLPMSFAQATNTNDLVSAIQFSVTATHSILGQNNAAAGTAGANDGTGSSLLTGAVFAPAATNFDGSPFLEVAAKSSALTFSIDTCSVQWVKVAPATSYSCSGTTTHTVADNATLESIQSAANGGTPITLSPAQFGQTGATFTSSNGDVKLYSLVSVTLPQTANNSFTGAGIQLAFNAVAIQRAGTVTGK